MQELRRTEPPSKLARALENARGVQEVKEGEEEEQKIDEKGRKG